MLNKRPIIVNGFHRGGTNIIMNLLASHPDVCMAAGETNEIFHGKSTDKFKKWINRAFYLPIWASTRQHIFHPRDLSERRKVPGFVHAYIDSILYFNKLSAIENEFKYENVRYTKSEILRARTLTKNGTATVLANDLFAQMYPDATFISLVRDGLAICEGMMRREFSLEYSARAYETVCQKMIRDSQSVPNYHIVRFEDMVSNPEVFVEEIYGYAGLDISQTPKFRFETRASMGKNGNHEFKYGEAYRELHWVEKNELNQCYRADVNENQVALLSEQDKEAFFSIAKGSMEHFGYVRQLV